MFRKSVSFFILVALLWILLWVYIPDASPDKLTISDVFRGFLLLFSLMALSFSILLLTIRYKGVDIATHFIPHAGIAMWLGKHAYEYSQPKTVIYFQIKNLNHTRINTEVGNSMHELTIHAGETKSLNLGFIQQNPVLQWLSIHQQSISAELDINEHLKKLGKNIQIDVIIDQDTINHQLR